MRGTKPHSRTPRTRPGPILQLFDEWRRLIDAPFAGEAEMESRLKTMNALVARMSAKRPRTARELAAVIVASTHFGAFGLDARLIARLPALAGVAEAGT